MQIQVPMISTSATVAPIDTKQLALLQKQRATVVTAHQKELKFIDAQIADITKKQTAVATKVLSAKLKGYSYVAESAGTAGEPVTRKTLAALHNVRNVKRGSFAYAVSPTGVRNKILKFDNRDPITGSVYKGYSWRWVSAKVKAKFSV